ncbi:DAK2 domain-containing protein [Paenibacillus flagellatus]|uniref:DhaL domain-containing protein n=1 Tax=Paenibacillus flagellatus TaxID=2211139 RepID=A0A2V5K527_9BACL|nr:DAK2 domain-containing protein [Paenibacillus flagellatus]PYI54338.1 hypothetical protein DLM86_12755 [Paenibacillus flagellatus]
MIIKGAEHLHANAENVNALNVFPVPDGDTGTNMNLTLASGAKELRRKTSPHIGKSAEALSKGLLMGARGNSGVILSQLFRGFAKAIQDAEEIDAAQFAAALQSGVDTAYKAVVKPVEGTILTVAREAAKHAVASVRRDGDIAELMDEVLAKAKEALAKTPEQLPVLKQVGVVDAGGQGLVCIYEGFVAALSGEAPAYEPVSPSRPAPFAEAGTMPGHGASDRKKAQSHMATEDIEFGYCTEFMVRLEPGKTPGAVFDEAAFRGELSGYGDSVLVVADDELVKVHLHAERPGEVLTAAQRFGELVKIKIENMREQHAHIVEDESPSTAEVRAAAADDDAGSAGPAKPSKPFGFVAVAAGDGVAAIFESLGADVVLSGGQTMNPSTEDIVGAIRRVDADTVFVLPNNSNIVLAAKQACDMTDRRVVVVPTKTIPQGMAALLAFRANATAERNAESMEEAVARVRSGQVTHAVRDSQIDGMDIRAGDYLGIRDGHIVVSTPDLLAACSRLIDDMMAGGGEVVTILTGAEASEPVTAAIAAYVEEAYPDAELEVHPGGQPVYSYLIAVE